MDLLLDGSRVLVTGAGGFLGGPIARVLASEGAVVAVHHRDSRDEEPARALAEEIGGHLVRADLSDEREADELVPVAVNLLGGLDGCVANAGRFPAEDAPINEMTLDRWKTVIDDNLASMFLTCRAFFRHVQTTGQGSLVLLGSAAGIFGDRGRVDYASAKAAITGGFLLTLKNEITRLAPDGRVNAVVPAWTTTDERLASVPEDVVTRTVATQARAQLGRPEEVAAAVAWLMSPRASHVTGEVLRVTGGMEGRVLR